MPLPTRFLTSFALSATLLAAACGKSGDTTQSGAPSPERPSATQPVSSESLGDDAFNSLPAPYNEASYSLGRRTFKLCGACHTTTAGGQNLVGPNLHGVFGRKAGTLDSYPYSNALRKADFVWTPERLEEWLSSPNAFLPGNNMSFAGVRREEDRHAVIAYLMVQTGYDPTASEDEAEGDETEGPS